MKYLCLILSSFLALSCATESAKSNESTENETELSLEEVWFTDTTSLLTPESVIYDTQNELYYVSCINGVPPAAKDGDGYIAVLNKDGSVKNASWITGMDAPKGMGIVGTKLFVADITKVLEIDIESGKIIDSFEIEGSQFLNDITVNGDEVFISDSNTSTIYKLVDGEVSTLVQNEALGGSNGLFVSNNQLYVAGFGSGDFHKIDMDGTNPVLVADSINGGDGIVKYKDQFLVSNWNGQVFSVNSDGTTTLLLDTKEAKRNAADIAIGSEEDLLIVPEFFANKVTAYKLNP